MSDDSRPVIIGRIVGVFGVRGWVKVRSYTQPPINLLTYRPWRLISATGEIAEQELVSGHAQGKGLVALLKGCTNPESALFWVGWEIAVPRTALPPPEDGEYYWTDLIGLRVVTLTGVDLGSVSYLFETGANDVLVVTGDRERLIPYLSGRVVQKVDLAARRMVVDWEPEF